MIAQIDIIAIEGRTDEGNGVSRPFRCLGEDDARYFVKLKNAGYTQLVKEWMAGRLAQEMGLQAADIRQVRIPKELVAGNDEFERELGDGIAFGSRRVEPAERLAMAFVREDPDGVLSRILLFDWWFGIATVLSQKPEEIPICCGNSIPDGWWFSTTTTLSTTASMRFIFGNFMPSGVI